MSNIDYDKYGHCALCHCNLLVRSISDFKMVWRFSGKKTDMELNLNDGSKLHVTLCKKCFNSYNHDTHSQNLMNSVIKGWEVECEQLVADPSKPDWTPERKAKHMDRYSKKEIVQ